jgi:hypothetical protein
VWLQVYVILRVTSRLKARWLMSKEERTVIGDVAAMEILFLVRPALRRALPRVSRTLDSLVHAHRNCVAVFMQQYARKALYDRCDNLIAKMVARGLTPSAEMLACAVVAHGRASREAAAVVRAVSPSRTPPPPRRMHARASLTAVMSTCIATRRAFRRASKR